MTLKRVYGPCPAGNMEGFCIWPGSHSREGERERERENKLFGPIFCFIWTSRNVNLQRGSGQPYPRESKPEQDCHNARSIHTISLLRIPNFMLIRLPVGSYHVPCFRIPPQLHGQSVPNPKTSKRVPKKPTGKSPSSYEHQRGVFLIQLAQYGSNANFRMLAYRYLELPVS